MGGRDEAAHEAASRLVVAAVQQKHGVEEQQRHQQARRGGEDGRVHRLHGRRVEPVSYTHLRAHETVLDLVCRLLLEKKKTEQQQNLE